VGRDQLGSLAAASEGDPAVAGADEAREQLGGLDVADPRAPECSSSSGGFHSANTRSPDGEPSSVTSATGRPQMASARAPGAPIVAEEKMNVGEEP